MTSISTNIALTFFLLLALGHVVGDFVLQPYWLVLAKRKGWIGLIIHVGVVTFVTALLIWGVIPNWWVWVIVLFVLHLFIDQFRTFIFTDNSKGKGLLLLILDQLAHLFSIMFIAWAATGWVVSDLAILFTPAASNQDRLIAYFIGLAALISTIPVFEAEITVGVWAAQGKETNQTVRIDAQDRWLGSAERIVAVILILLGFWAIAPLVFIPRLMIMLRQDPAGEQRTAITTKVLTSFTSALIVGIVLINIATPIIGF